MKTKVFFLGTVILLLSAVASVLDPAGKYLPAAHGQNIKTEKEWVTCREKLEATVDKQKIGTPWFDAALRKVCGIRPGKPVKAMPASAKADLPFKIDCSQLDRGKQSLCDAYIAKTRDKIYPMLREFTGKSFADCRPVRDCCDAIYYTILPGTVYLGGQAAGGYALVNRITYAERNSGIYDVHNYDVHELFHSFASCTNALDEHVFHWPVQHMVFTRMGRSLSGAQHTAADKETAVKWKNTYLNDLNKMSESELNDNGCKLILAYEIMVAYFDLGEDAIKNLYRLSMATEPRPIAKPNQKLVNVWGDVNARKVQVILETLKKDYNYSFTDLPSICGYRGGLFLQASTPVVEDPVVQDEGKAPDVTTVKPPEGKSAKKKKAAESSAFGSKDKFNPQSLVVNEFKGGWGVMDGTNPTRAFFSCGQDRRAEAEQVLQVMQHYGMTEQQWIGKTGMDIFLASGQAPEGSYPSEKCVSFDPQSLKVEQKNLMSKKNRDEVVRTYWALTDDRKTYRDFRDDQEGAEKALEFIRSHGFTNKCYVGSFQYWRR